TIHRGMAKEPQRRYASAAQFANAFSQPTATVPVAATVPVGRPAEETIALGKRPDPVKGALLGPFAGLFDCGRNGVRRGPAWLPLLLLVPVLLLLAMLAFSTRPPSLVAVPDVKG